MNDALVSSPSKKKKKKKKKKKQETDRLKLLFIGIGYYWEYIFMIKLREYNKHFEFESVQNVGAWIPARVEYGKKKLENRHHLT